MKGSTYLRNLNAALITNVAAATYTALVTDDIIQVDYTTTGVHTTTLMTAVGNKGQILTIVDGDGNASGNTLTVDGAGGETIDGATTTTITADYGSVTIYSDGVEWFTI